MIIKSKMIDKGIRIEGEFLRAISPLKYEKVQRFASPISTTFLSMFKMKNLNCEKINITGYNKRKMRLCIMKSENSNKKTIGILWLHGGGYSLGAPEMALITLPRFLIKNFNCVIIAPDYTLSAKEPYPAALIDAFTTLLWMKDNRKNLQIDYDKFIVGGESAGAGLAIGLSLYCRDKGEDLISFQIPLYPMLDDRVTKTSSNNDAPVWDTNTNKSAWRIYLGDKVINSSVPPYAAPARETNFKNIPPIVSLVGDIDLFYDEDISFFTNVKNEGIDVDYMIAKGCYHAFDMMAPYAKISKDSTRYLMNTIDEYIEKYYNLY